MIRIFDTQNLVSIRATKTTCTRQTNCLRPQHTFRFPGRFPLSSMLCSVCRAFFLPLISCLLLAVRISRSRELPCLCRCARRRRGARNPGYRCRCRRPVRQGPSSYLQCPRGVLRRVDYSTTVQKCTWGTRYRIRCSEIPRCIESSGCEY